SDLAKFYKDDQREFELQALLKMMKPCYPDLTEKDLRDAPWDPLAPSTKAGSLFLRTLAP
ncbi:MAG TPA: hypothetical protein VEF91_08025, partial [Verrucomicrobiae bacterium]|nr:hypothetical protein [Verrucomicrobiae bacterium]